MEELNTPMDASAASCWLSELEMDDCNFFPEDNCHLNLLDVDIEEFLSHDIASALLSSEHTETSSERPSKLLKTSTSSSSNISSITENLSPELSHSSSLSSFQSQILSFENSKSSPTNNTTQTQFYGFDCTLNSKQNEIVKVSLPQLGNTSNTTFSAQTTKGSSKNQNFETKTTHGKRSLVHAQVHIIAERKRREKLSQSFIALAALVPGLKKMDKATVLADAIEYVKELKERVTVLEEESKKTKVESVVVLNKPELSGDDDSSSCDESIIIDAATGGNEPLLQVEARVSGEEVLLRIHCQRQKGLLVKLLAQIQSLHLFVVNSSVLPFGDSIIDITIIAQMGEGYNLTIRDLVKTLRTATLSVQCHNNGNVGASLM